MVVPAAARLYEGPTPATAAQVTVSTPAPVGCEHVALLTVVPAPKVGAYSQPPHEESFRRAAAIGAFTAPFNISGQPAASVPAGLTSDGSPIGVPIAGRLNGEGTGLALSRQLEEAMPWSHRLSPVFDR